MNPPPSSIQTASTEKTPPASDACLPSRGITREVSLSRRISRQNTFRLLSVEVAEEDEDGHSSPDGDGGRLTGRVGGTLLFEKELINDSQVGNSDVAAGYANPTTLSSGRGLSRCNSGRRSRPALSRDNSIGSISSGASFDGPMREILVPFDDESRYWECLGGQRRRSSEITTESLEQLIRQFHRQSGNDDSMEREQQQSDSQTDQISNPPIEHQSEDNQVEVKTPLRGIRNHFGSFKGSLQSIFTVIHGNLKNEIDNNETSIATSSESASVNAADTPEGLAALASKLDDVVKSDGRSEDGSLDTFEIRGGYHDSHSLNKAKFSRKSKSCNFLNRWNKLDDDAVNFHEESESEFINGFHFQRGFNDSVSLAKLKHSRKCKSCRWVSRSDNICAVDFHEESQNNDAAANAQSGTDELLNYYYLRGGLTFHDSNSLAKAKMARKCSTGIYSSTNTDTTADSTAWVRSLPTGNFSSSSFDTTSFDSFLISGNANKNEVDIDPSEASKSVDDKSNNLNDNSSAGSGSMDLCDLFPAKFLTQNIAKFD